MAKPKSWVVLLAGADDFCYPRAKEEHMRNDAETADQSGLSKQRIGWDEIKSQISSHLNSDKRRFLDHSGIGDSLGAWRVANMFCNRINEAIARLDLPPDPYFLAIFQLESDLRDEHVDDATKIDIRNWLTVLKQRKQDKEI